MGLKNVNMSQLAANQANGKPQIFNVELSITKGIQPASLIYGEITICDYLAGQKNTQEQNNSLHRLGKNLSFDNWMHRLNNKLRPAAQATHANGKPEDLGLDKLWADFSKVLSSKNFDKDFGILHAMFYSFLEPVLDQVANMEIKEAVKALKEQHSLLSFEDFSKLKKILISDEKKGKAVTYDDKAAKLTRSNKGEKILPKEG